MNYIGDIVEDATVAFSWNSFNAPGASVTRATDGTVKVRRHDDGTDCTGTSVTDTEDTPATGIHECKIDTNDNVNYTPGNDYTVWLDGAVIDGQTVNAALATFSIENRYTSGKLLKYMQLLSRKDAAIATDNSAEVTEINTNEGSGAGAYDNATDSQEAIADEIAAGVATINVPTAGTITTGDQGATTFADAGIDDGVYWTIGDENGANTIENIATIALGTNKEAVSLDVEGRYTRQGGGGYVVEIFVRNYTTPGNTDFDKLSSGTSTTEMRSRTNDQEYEFSLLPRHTNRVVDGADSIGDVQVKFVSTRTTTANGDVLRLDIIGVSAVAEGAVSPTIIADAVWNKDLQDIRHDETETSIAGHLLDHSSGLHTDVSVSNTGLSFTLTNGTTAADAYVGMMLEIKDETASSRVVEVRRITSWTSGRVITVDRAFSFVPQVADHAHVLGLSYGDVNVQAMAADVEAAIVTAIFAKTGITAGGVYTFEKAIKIITAWAAGDWIDKSGEAGTHEILDPDDGSTVIMEAIQSETTPFKDITVL